MIWPGYFVVAMATKPIITKATRPGVQPRVVRHAGGAAVEALPQCALQELHRAVAVLVKASVTAVPGTMGELARRQRLLSAGGIHD